jgi:acetylornithine deacetylase
LLKKQITAWLKQHEEEAVLYLQSLVKEDSIQGNERGVQQLVIQRLEQMGLEVDVWHPSGELFLNHPHFCATRTEFSNSPNVVGVWRGKGEGRSIILNGHVDVVPPGDVKQWDDDPYSGKLIDGKLFGRGATDMKGGNVSLLLAIQCLKELGVSLSGDVIFQSVIEEESGGAGTLAAIVKGYKADAAIIPEPTNMKIFPSQQGSMWFRISVKGRSAHGGTRYEGVSSVEKSVPIIHKILALEKERNNAVTDPLYQTIPIPLPINIGKIKGGDWPSSVPDLVTIEGRIGVGPDETLEKVKRQFEAALLSIEDDWLKKYPPKIEWFGARWLPGNVPIEHELIETLREHYRGVYGEDPTVEASPWGTDGGLLTQAGETPSIVFGPGVTSVAHYPNEYIELQKVFDCAIIIALTIIDWCGGKRS